ncbi:MAG: acyl carrier protein [Taibaiella sp.]|nr:acyl carrier protein [Taibaiella sp.]
MEHSELLKQVNDIFIDVLDNKEIRLAENTTAADVDEWDSLSHIQLVVAIEKKYKIRFTTNEIQQWKTVGDLVSNLEAKLKG